ncbi:hypothetical protein ACFWPQ_01990 [Streptomyces sp. NPDC058464]|uniref:hypothetical protein n=1 Tax=Streptomyces sp. NPDC058464 TaxID=3346511 RepID=UPI003648E60F
MTSTDTADDEYEVRPDWLLSLSPEQIARYSFGTILDWLDARREQRIARLRAACWDLREQCSQRERAYARIAAAVAASEAAL